MPESHVYVVIGAEISQGDAQDAIKEYIEHDYNGCIIGTLCLTGEHLVDDITTAINAAVKITETAGENFIHRQENPYTACTVFFSNNPWVVDAVLDPIRHDKDALGKRVLIILPHPEIFDIMRLNESPHFDEVFAALQDGAKSVAEVLLLSGVWPRTRQLSLTWVEDEVQTTIRPR